MAKKKSVLPSTVGSVDHVDDREIRGWIFCPSNSALRVVLFIKIDGNPLPSTCADLHRDDVLGAGPTSADVGFQIVIPERYRDGLKHQVEFFHEDGGTLSLWQTSSSEVSNRCEISSAEVLAQPVAAAVPKLSNNLSTEFVIHSNVDGLQDGAIRGWAIARHPATGQMVAGLSVLVTMQGHPIAQVAADQMRVDVAEHFGCSPNCGFAFVLPPRDFAGKMVELVFKLIPGGVELSGSPYIATFPDLDAYRKIRSLSEEIDKLFVQLWHLRASVKGLLPADTHNLQSYYQWAPDYFQSLNRRSSITRAGKKAQTPLVSIVCPTYRPRMPDFIAAVESVFAQTYSNWELIIVDDASDSNELTACIEQFTKRDKRVVSIKRKKNEGISAATNAALAGASGRFVAFFDHDDLLVDRAIEIMVAAALRTGAKLLYCDEDKIDDSGVLGEVHFKPDWNYRLLLAQNYVCHLLFVERAELAKVGPLSSECDGAQDHDLILRLSEQLTPAQIHHVPEVLYHWRKTPFSTASSGKSKPYTVAAGIKAVSNHLRRKGLHAEVTSPLQITCYEIQWKLDRHPKVTLIIPYREHIGMTRECVEAVISITRYSNYEIVLVDNWSTSDEALAFAAQMSQRKDVVVIRVEEPFNFSRINNIAVDQTSGELVLFMNNDVVVSEPEWLATMVGEILSDPRIGAVGNKLLYPSGLVQHGGVVLGVGGVADHAHRGLTADAPGYMARAICAQDLSAVTAACMLCRRDAFNEVGMFDEAELRVAYNDVDLCLKLGQAGYRIVWTPLSTAEHRESLSRGNDFKPEHQVRFFHENQVMQTRWKDVLPNDPHYNRNFSRRSGIFRDLESRDE